jgi:hypothetical protein
LKKKNIDKTRHFKLKQKQIVLIGIVITIPLILGAYVYGGVGVGIGQSGAQADPMLIHIHPELSILMDNKPLSVPSNIGIDSSLWRDHSLDEYGMQAMQEMGMSGMAPLHTHDDNGIIHVESSINRDYTLGEFFKIWGLDLENKVVKAMVDGKPSTDYKSILLKDGEKIALDIQSN